MEIVKEDIGVCKKDNVYLYQYFYRHIQPTSIPNYEYSKRRPNELYVSDLEKLISIIEKQEKVINGYIDIIYKALDLNDQVLKLNDKIIDRALQINKKHK